MRRISILLDDLQVSNLSGMKTHGGKLYIHVHGLGMSSATRWKEAKKALIDPQNPNRGGAPDQLESVEMVNINYLLNHI